MEVMGLAAAISGALLARHSPAVSPSTRAAFAWVSDLHRIRWVRRAGWTMSLGGLALDGLLFALWVSKLPFDTIEKLHLASLAQGLLLNGVLLVAVVGVYRMLLSADNGLTEA